MNRRVAIRNMALILGSVAVLPCCLNDKGKPVVQLNKLKIDAEQETLVNNLVETILPKTDTPGAAELGINLFVFKMIDDCYSEEARKDFMTGLADFAADFRKQNNETFNECTAKERTAFVSIIDEQSKSDKADDNQKMMAFYKMVKDQTVFGYTTSKYFMTKQVVYELVPGRYKAYFPVKEAAAV